MDREETAPTRRALAILQQSCYGARAKSTAAELMAPKVYNMNMTNGEDTTTMAADDAAVPAAPVAEEATEATEEAAPAEEAPAAEEATA